MEKQQFKKGYTRSKFLAVSAVAMFLCCGVNNAYAEPYPQTIESTSNFTTITGTVVDENEQPIIGANVMERGTSRGSMTDVDGKFSIKVTTGSTLKISYIGYASKEIKSANNLKIVLKEDKALLDEVIVLGYGQQKKANVTGAVSSVDISKTLEARPTQDVAKALQGAVPGLTILANEGGINSKPTLTIRGVGTLSNDEKSAPLIVVDGVPMEDISFLNTNDIQNVSVLKDAASTSIYGTRAAFGVILITTKSAKTTEKVSVTYTNNFAWDKPTYLPDYPDVPTQIRALSATNKRAGVENELFGMYLDKMLPLAESWLQRHGGKTGYREMIAGDDYTVNPDGSGAMYFADWDVKKIMFRNWSPAQTHNIAIQGTTGKTSYYLSMSYNNKEGVLKFNSDKLQKYTATMNVTSNITDWLQIGGRFNYSDKQYTTPNTRRYTYQYMWRWGSFFGPYGTINGVDARNDIAYLKQAGDDKTDDSYMRIGAFVKATIIKGLTLNADFTFNLNNTNNKSAALPVTFMNTWGGNISGPTTVNTGTGTNIFQSATKDQSYALNIFANYEWNLREDHHFNFMLGGNLEEGTYNYQWGKRLNLLENSLPEFELATGDQTVGGNHSHWGACGYFGRINYDYKGIWLLEANGRYDGSSKFPKKDHWAFFPSGSIGYRFSQENYFDEIRDVISNGKLRASIGEIGNQAVGAYKFLSTITPVKPANMHWLDAAGNKVSAYDMPSLVSETLGWERIQTIDVGLDLGLFNNEITLGFDWYQRTTRDMLAPGQTLPETLGTTSPLINAGTLRSRGWELSLDWRHRFGEFNVYANFNISDFKTKVVDWTDESRLINKYYSGANYGDIWGFETDRFFTKNDFNADGTYAKGVANQKGLEQDGFVFGEGDIKFKDLDGSGIIDGGKGTAEDHGDLKVIGNSNPRYEYSFHLGGSWKGIDIDCFFQGVGKRDMWTQSAFVMPFMRGADAIYANQTNYWTEENPDAEFPRLYPGNSGYGNVSGLARGNHNFYPQDRYLVNMAYLRFKNLTIGYTLPQQWVNKVYLQKIRVYFSANNLCELYKPSKAPVDPEVNTSESASDGTNDYANGTWGRTTPMARTLSFGLQATF